MSGRVAATAPKQFSLRPVQTSLMECDEHPVGPLPGSVMFGDNATLIAAVAPIYLTGSVLDVTYGQGNWWRKFTPAPFASHDLAIDGVDFCALPEESRSWDTVCFDPPYVPRLGTKPAVRLDDLRFRERYGLDTSRGHRATVDLIFAGLAECARVSRRWVLVKCCDYVTSRRLYVGHIHVVAEAERLGLRVHDLIVHAAGAGPGDRHIREVRRSRRAHSYLLVFSVPRPRSNVGRSPGVPPAHGSLCEPPESCSGGSSS